MAAVHYRRHGAGGNRQPEGDEPVCERRHDGGAGADSGERERSREPGLDEAKPSRGQRQVAE